MTEHDETSADRVEELFREGRHQEAIDLCRRICGGRETSPRDWLLYGCISADAGDSATAMTALKRAAELDPHFAEAQLGLGKLLAAAGDHAAAITRLEKATQLQPDNPETWLTLGVVYGLAMQPDAAEASCRRALELQPTSANARFNLANSLAAQGKLGEAEVEYLNAIEMDQGSAMCWSMLAQIRMGLGKSAEAESAAQRSVALDPRHGEAHYLLGSLQEARGENERARQHYTQTRESLPNLIDACLGLGRVCRGLGDYAAAVECYQEALKLRPDDAELYFQLGECFRLQQRFGKAEQSYRTAVALDNDHLKAHYRLAFGLLKAGHHEEAAGHFAEILRINPGDEQAQHLLAAQRGETTSAAPGLYVSTLFDGVADDFESRLVGTLKYRTPELLHQLVRQFGSRDVKLFDIIDLGCGTGLCAPLFRDMAHRLHGVDISPKMIDKARERSLYDTLAVGDITASLRSEPDAWDLVIAADVLVYLGDLQAVFQAVASALRPGGHFAFSVEASGEDDTYVLRPSGRYAHGCGYVRSLSAASGLEEVTCQPAVLRHEHGKDVRGYLFLLRRPVSLSQNPYRIRYSFT